MGKASVIVNPVAGGGQSAGRWARLEPLLRKGGLDFDWHYTEYQGDGARLAAQAAEAGAELVVAVGGDGTINEIVNGLLRASNGGPTDVRLGILPTGRGVDLCRTVGIPLDGVEAVERVLGNRVVRIDAGELEYTVSGSRERRYFANFAGMGFDVEVTRRSNRLRPRGGGTIPYLTAVFLSLLQFKSKRVEMVLDGEVSRRRVATIVVANGQYFGGGMRVAPQASATDGVLDLVILEEMTKLDLIINLPKIYEGTHITHPKVRLARAERVEVHSVDPVYVQADGDPVGETPVSIGVLKGALALVV